MQHHSNHCKHFIVFDDSNDVTFFCWSVCFMPKKHKPEHATTYALNFKTLSKRYTNGKCKLAKALIIDIIALHGQNRANTLTTHNSESSAKKFKYKLQEIHGP